MNNGFDGSSGFGPSVLASISQPNRRALMGFAGALLAAAALTASAESYTIQVRNGFNYLANQLNRGANTIDEVLPSVPDGTVVFKFEKTTQTWAPPNTFLAGLGWVDSLGFPSTTVLSPGEGFVLENSGPDFNLTFLGALRVPTLPVVVAAGEICLIGRQIPGVGTYENIIGCPPEPGAILDKWNPAGATFDTYNFLAAGWSPNTPTAAIGESVFVHGPTCVTQIPDPPKVAKWSQPPGYLVFPENPQDHGVDRPSSFDWKLLMEPGTPFTAEVVADDFLSDGRPITCVRWWGSYLNDTQPGFEDGFVLSFFSDMPSSPNDPVSKPAQLLASYIAPAAAVSVKNSATIGADGLPIFEYLVELKNTCLDHAVAPLATPEAFLERSNTVFWLSVSAEVGHIVVPITGPGGGIQWTNQPSTKSSDFPFWGWHTSPIHFNDVAVTGLLSMQDTNWIYGDWRPSQATAGERDQAFELLTPTSNGPVEIDSFSYTLARLTVQLPDGSSDTLTLAGPSRVEVLIGPGGETMDSDDNGLDDAQAEMTHLELRGSSPLTGPVVLRLRSSSQSPFRRTLGRIEETVNSLDGRLDLPPFAPEGTAESVFDVFFEIEVAGVLYHNLDPKRLRAVIRHKPPAEGDTYESVGTGQIELVDENDRPSQILVGHANHIPNIPKEIDFFPTTQAELTLRTPNLGDQTITLTGPTTVRVCITPDGGAADTDGDGLDQVPTEMVALDLMGNSLVGPVRVTLNPSRPSPGQIEEQVNNTPGTLDIAPFTPTGQADSSFDVFPLIEFNGQVLVTASPLHLEAVIHHKPPAPGDTYTNALLEPVELVDPATGKGSGIFILREVHTPNPPQELEVDYFPDSQAIVDLMLPDGSTHTVHLSGPTTVHVQIGPNGECDDSDGNGLDDVDTEIVQLELTGSSPLGPVILRLADPSRHPALRSVGLIEETADTQTGRLDVAPFASSGSAWSYFNVYFDVEVGGQIYHAHDPKRMRSYITHKPPEGGTAYFDPVVIELFDDNEEATGIKILRTTHVPTGPEPEIDHFPESVVDLTICLPDGREEPVHAAGPTTVQVWVGPNGEAGDSDGDGRDDVATEMVELNLTGTSSLGPVSISLAQPGLHGFRSTGMIEELVNNTPGTLDVAPFTTSGLADSFFNIFVDITINTPAGPLVLHNHRPKRMRTVIDHKPPGPGQTYEDPVPIDLFDANDNPTLIRICKTRHTPFPPEPEVDHWDNTVSRFSICSDTGLDIPVTAAGPTTVEVYIGPSGEAADTDGDGRDQVATRMIQLDLNGFAVGLGAIHVGLRDPAKHPYRVSGGEIEEQVNNTPGILDVQPFTATGLADSSFDVFFEITVTLPDGTRRVLHNDDPKHMRSVIDHKPPREGTIYEDPDRIPLFDENDEFSGFYLCKATHQPQPPKERDFFEYSIGKINIKRPDGAIERVVVAGPTRVEVCVVEPEGLAADTDGDGLDQVKTLMTLLDLRGNSSFGPVQVRLNPSQPTTGEIEETVNNTSGVLDLPPFTATGSAHSHFHVIAEIVVGTLVLHPAVPLHIEALITHKPPAPGEAYMNLFVIPDTGSGGGVATPCIVPDNGSGTVTLPPAGCDYLSPESVHLIIDGLPPGTTIEMSAIHREFFCNTNNPVCSYVPAPDLCAEPGGSLGGEKECTQSRLQLNLSGTGLLAGYARVLDIPAGFETHVGPRTPGDAVQTFDTDMFRLFGQIIGDPDFDLLRITAGTDYGLPSPGTTTLTRLGPPGSAFQVDSFFDIAYRIDFVGSPSGPLGGMSGSTTGTIRMQAGSPPMDMGVPLLTSNGQPTGFFITGEMHTPNPRKEIDEFPISEAEIVIQTLNGSERVRLSGPSTVQVCLEEPEGLAADTDADGRDQVPTEIVQLNLMGMSTVGPVQVTLRADRRSMGEIEERFNATPGVLDLAPFAPGGYADSSFDVWTEITLNGESFWTDRPLHLTSVISHKPPAPGESYQNPFLQQVELIDPLTGLGTGIFIIEEIHTPVPKDQCPPLRIERVAGAPLLKISWPAGGDCILQCTRRLETDPAKTVWINIDPPYEENQGRYCVFVDPLQQGPIAFYRLCKRPGPPRVSAVFPTSAGPGDIVTITGSGFGNNPDNLCVVSLGRSDNGQMPAEFNVPLRVLSASDTRLTARLGPVPPNAQPGPIMVGRGQGNAGRPQFVFEDIQAVEPIWVWNNLGGDPQHGMSPNDFQPEYTPPAPEEFWFFSGPPTNGVLCVYIDKPWPPNAEISIVARAHDETTGAGGHDLDGPTIRLLGEGTALECAERIADILRCAFLQQAGVVIEVQVEETSPGIVKITVSIPGGQIDRGLLYICVRPTPSAPTIDSVNPRTGTTGDIVTIQGSGFGNDPDNLCVVVAEESASTGLDGGGQGASAPPQRFIPLRALSVEDGMIRARLGVVPPDARPGPIMVALGQGRVGRPQFAFPDILPLEPIWVWHGNLPGAVAPDPFLPVHTPPETNQCWFVSGPPTNGVLCVFLDPEKPWPEDAVVNITARAHDEVSGAGGNDLDGPTLRFIGGGSTLDCAHRIADVLRCAFIQQAGVVVDVDVTVTPDGRIKITVSIPGGHIDRGMLTICVTGTFPPVGTSDP